MKNLLVLTLLTSSLLLFLSCGHKHEFFDEDPLPKIAGEYNSVNFFSCAHNGNTLPADERPNANALLFDNGTFEITDSMMFSMFVLDTITMLPNLARYHEPVRGTYTIAPYPDELDRWSLDMRVVEPIEAVLMAQNVNLMNAGAIGGTSQSPINLMWLQWVTTNTLCPSTSDDYEMLRVYDRQ